MACGHRGGHRNKGATTVYVDSSIAPANVPPGVYNGFGPAKLACYNTEDVDILNITDGATLSEWSGINGLFVSCACVTTAAFSFSEFASFNLFDFATLSLAVGALVPAIQIATRPFSWALISRMGSVDNSNAPTVATMPDCGGIKRQISHPVCRPQLLFPHDWRRDRRACSAQW